MLTTAPVEVAQDLIPEERGEATTVEMTEIQEAGTREEAAKGIATKTDTKEDQHLEMSAYCAEKLVIGIDFKQEKLI